MGSAASYSIVATAKWYTQGKATYGKKGFNLAKSQVFKDDDLPAGCMEGKVVAITGSNQGIGFESALQCAKLGAFVYLICRNPSRATEAADKIKAEAGSDRVDTAILDVSEFAAIRQFAVDFQATLASRGQKLDVLVNNAGAMPSTRSTTSEGNEQIAALTYGGCLLLTSLLVPAIPSGTGRIINVSSGGAYSVVARSRDLNCEANTNYDGRLLYAVAKRNQLVITEKMSQFFASGSSSRVDSLPIDPTEGSTSSESEEEKDDVICEKKDISVFAMHPGWADTTAIREAMPEFYADNKDMLRSAGEGADTVTFLAGSPKVNHSEHSGKFFFDRQVVPMAFPWTKTEPDAKLKQKVWAACGRYVGGNLPGVGL